MSRYTRAAITTHPQVGTSFSFEVICDQSNPEGGGAGAGLPAVLPGVLIVGRLSIDVGGVAAAGWFVLELPVFEPELLVFALLVVLVWVSV